MWFQRVLQTLNILIIVFIGFGDCFWMLHPSNLNESHELKSMDFDIYEQARKRKKKGSYLKILFVGAILVKMIIFPLAVKAMAVMSTISVLMSAMSLIMSSIVGYAKLASRKSEPAVKVVHLNDVWSKGDELPKEYVVSPDSLEYNQNPPLEQIHFI